MEFSIARAMRIAKPSTPSRPRLSVPLFRRFDVSTFHHFTSPCRPFSLCRPRFSRTYKRISPRLSVLIRQYTGRVSLCTISRKTTEKSNRPNTCPIRELQSSAKAFFAYCHLRFCRTCAQQRARSRRFRYWYSLKKNRRPRRPYHPNLTSTGPRPRFHGSITPWTIITALFAALRCGPQSAVIISRYGNRQRPP